MTCIIADRLCSLAKATLPMTEHDDAHLDDVFAALNLRQTRLKHDQQVPQQFWQTVVWRVNQAPATLPRREYHSHNTVGCSRF
jgi:hypothetical protein